MPPARAVSCLPVGPRAWLLLLAPLVTSGTSATGPSALSPRPSDSRCAGPLRAPHELPLRQGDWKPKRTRRPAAGKGMLDAMECSGQPRTLRRRGVLPLLGAGLLGCVCTACAFQRRAEATATLVAPPQEQTKLYDPPRNKFVDAGFARGMASGMVDYERAVSERKRKLFSRLLQGLPRNGAVVVEVGMGAFPNALYLGSKSAPAGMDIVGVDPNDSMEEYARAAAEKAGLARTERGCSLRVAHGVAEALPLETGVADAAVCTLTLCSVLDPDKAVSEIRRILKPGGQFLFHEHVLSETDAIFAAAQRLATPAQVQRADGCHLDRRTLETIRAGGFQAVDGEYFELSGFSYLNPTVAGIATA